MGDRVVRAALVTAKVPILLAHGTRTVLNGLWLAALSEDDLRALDEHYYDDAGSYRTAEWNEQGLFPWEQRLVDEHVPCDGRVVVLACGGGREVLALRRGGRDAVGYEPHPALVAVAQQTLAAAGHPGCVHPVGRDAFPSGAGPCAAVLVGWGAYSLVHTSARRTALLRDAHAHLEAGAPVVLSFFERPESHREVRWTKAIADVGRRLRGAAALELGDTLSPNAVHLFTRAELADEATAAGFDVAAHGAIGEAEGSITYAAAVLRSR